MANIKFMWNGIKVDGKLTKVSYSAGPYIKQSGIEDGTVTIYGKDYISLPNIGLEIKNDTDIQEDYFRNDKIRIAKDNPMYKEAYNAYLKMEAHFQKLKDRN